MLPLSGRFMFEKGNKSLMKIMASLARSEVEAGVVAKAVHSEY